jgi:hypothetical protein
MAEEILNTLGFSVDGALTALSNLDRALQNTGLRLARLARRLTASTAGPLPLLKR